MSMPQLDSLKKIFNEQPDRRDDPHLLLGIMHHEVAPDSILKYSRLCFESEKSQSSDSILFAAYHKHGATWRGKANYDTSLQYLFKMAQIAENFKDPVNLGRANIEIANTYGESGDFKNAQTYYNRGLDFLRGSKDTLSLGLALFNIGDNLFEKRQLDSALVYTEESRDIFKRYNKNFYEAHSLGNLGRIYALQGDNRKGERYLREAIEVLKETDYLNATSDFLASMGEVYAERGDCRTAIDYAQRSLEAAYNHDLKQDIEEAHLMLSNLFEQVGNIPEAYNHYKQHVFINDSIRDIKTVEEMANLRTDFEIARKQTEVDLLNEQKANQRNIVVATGIASFLVMLLALGLYRRNKYIGRTKKIIEMEKNRSDKLLLNILPHETAMELKEKGKVSAKRFEEVTILFTDFRNFTHYAENLPPEELVKTVDFYFSKFDEIVEEHGLEKIKTVGDAYMCAAGVPFPVEDHAHRTLLAACDMLSFVEEAHKNNPKGETRFRIRIGVNSGPVVAGVVGSKKWVYDIWGDAVNTAARMETSSELGKINISENTYALVKDKFEFEYRGEIMVKNKGLMKMYFIKGNKILSQDNVA
ncbi:adenylate/guanylate cyclase domain-containing protein [Salinimicrobium xinjiangense]|uniref:adenylate/guanylate cyclase domain-containing protein n=1 Tax=Salinimicrobium xinjiangense TaxID=438596 RepID=UPI000A039C80|nr:adenylate/guanylate cyclase domain-containing protein [Salinimicrobium xinjiangense]